MWFHTGQPNVHNHGKKNARDVHVTAKKREKMTEKTCWVHIWHRLHSDNFDYYKKYETSQTYLLSFAFHISISRFFVFLYKHFQRLYTHFALLLWSLSLWLQLCGTVCFIHLTFEKYFRWFGSHRNKILTQAICLVSRSFHSLFHLFYV